MGSFNITPGQGVQNYLIDPETQWLIFERFVKLMSGDSVFACSPAAENVSHSTFVANPVTSYVTLQDNNGFVIETYDGPVTLAVTKSSSGGTVSISPTAGTAFMSAGKLPVMITGAGTWAVGTAQVNTATLVGTCTGSGNMTATVTAAGLTGSPKAYSVAVLNGDTPTIIAGKVAAVLAADPVLTALYAVTNPSGAPTTVVLTRKAPFAANDATLNIATATGTATGITTEATSVATTAGVAADSVTLTVSAPTVPALVGVANATCVLEMI